MEFKITETNKYKNLVKAEASVIELAKVESMQKIAQQLDRLNDNLESLISSQSKGVGNDGKIIKEKSLKIRKS